MRASFARVPDMKKDSEASSSANAPITMHALSELFDQKLSPLHTSITSLKNKFQSLQIHIDSEISIIRDEITDKLKDVNEKVEMHDVNLANMHDRIEDHEKAILVMKKYMFTGDDTIFSKD